MYQSIIMDEKDKNMNMLFIIVLNLFTEMTKKYKL